MTSSKDCCAGKFSPKFENRFFDDPRCDVKLTRRRNDTSTGGNYANTDEKWKMFWERAQLNTGRSVGFMFETAASNSVGGT
jgi:hypothetical protein